MFADVQRRNWYRCQWLWQIHLQWFSKWHCTVHLRMEFWRPIVWRQQYGIRFKQYKCFTSTNSQVYRQWFTHSYAQYHGCNQLYKQLYSHHYIPRFANGEHYRQFVGLFGTINDPNSKRRRHVFMVAKWSNNAFDKRDTNDKREYVFCHCHRCQWLQRHRNSHRDD